MNAYIKAISYHLPERAYTNDDFFSQFPEALSSAESLLKIGVKSRQIVNPQDTAADLAVLSAENFFREHQIDRSEIDFLLFCAQEFDYYGPTTACCIHDRLGLENSCGALDFNLGCSGFVYGLSLAKGLVESCERKNVLLLTSSTLSKKFNAGDKSSWFVFGDGAAATLISAREHENGIGKFVFGTNGKGAKKIIVEHGGARIPYNKDSFIERTDEYGNVTSPANFYMDGTSVFLFGLKTVPVMVAELMEKENIGTETIDLFIFHQANLFLIDNIRKKIGIPKEKVFNYMECVGNLVSSSIPVALAEAIKAGKAKQGDRILLAGFGTGLSWSCTLIKL